MSLAHRVQWYRDEVAEMLDYDSTEPDQAFGGTSANPWKTIDRLLNRAYTYEVNQARIEAPMSHLKVTYQFTWTSGNTTYELPTHIAFSSSLAMRDITDDEMGAEVRVYPSARMSQMYWYDQRTLHWGDTTGPTEDKTFLWEYIANAETLVDAAQEPILIPEQHKYLLVWSAAVQGRAEIDEDEAPSMWLEMLRACREDYMMELSQGRLHFTAPPMIAVQLPHSREGL